jgi:hypothetical protein
MLFLIGTLTGFALFAIASLVTRQFCATESEQKQLPQPHLFDPDNVNLGEYVYIGNQYADAFEILGQIIYEEMIGKRLIVFEIYDPVMNRVLFLSCKRYYDQIWIHRIHRPLDAIELEMIKSVVSLDHSLPLPLDLTLHAMQFCTNPANFEQKIKILTTKKGNSQPSTDTLKRTEYATKLGGHELVIEKWNDGSRIMLGHPVTDITLYSR